MLAWRASSVASIRRSRVRVSGSPGGKTFAGSNFATTTAALLGVGVIPTRYHAESVAPRPAQASRARARSSRPHRSSESLAERRGFSVLRSRVGPCSTGQDLGTRTVLIHVWADYDRRRSQSDRAAQDLCRLSGDARSRTGGRRPERLG